MNTYKAQLFGTNAFSRNVMSTFAVIYSQSIVNTSNFFTYFLSKKTNISKITSDYKDKTDSLRVI